MNADGIRRLARSPIAAIAVVTVPFLVAAVRLATRAWYPVLDLAMTEFRVRDVGTRYTPLIGLPGRIGDFPDQGSHPGPTSFYLVSVLYRLTGSAAVSMLLGALSVGVASIIACILVSRRLGGTFLRGAVVVLLLVIVQGYGFGILGQPWNPYLPLLPWSVVVIAVWAVFTGDHAVLWLAVVAGSVCAQTHLPYVALAGGLVVSTIGLVGWRWANLEAGSDDRRRCGRQLAIGVGLGLVCWVPVLVDQVARTQNLSMLVEYFTDSPEDPIGLRAGIELLLRHLDVTRLVGGSVSGSGVFADASSQSTGAVLPGAALLVAWVVAAAMSFGVLRHRRLQALHAVVAICLLLELVSMARIFGKVWFYLTLWAWSVTAIMTLATLWTFAEMVRPRLQGRSALWFGRAIATSLGVVGVVAWSAVVVDAVRVDVPEPRLSRSLGAVVGPTAQALRDGVGAADGEDGRYSVLWNDAYFFGSQGYGMISELERRGFDAGAPDTWRVPVTPHRVIEPRDATAVVQFVTGSYLERWRAEPAAIEVATFEPRSPEEMAEFDDLRAELIAGLGQLPLDAAARDALVETVDVNLFGVQLDPAVPPSLQRIVNRMLELGQETAVFIVPPDFYDDVS